jgi:hypothetical protein
MFLLYHTGPVAETSPGLEPPENGAKTGPKWGQGAGVSGHFGLFGVQSAGDPLGAFPARAQQKTAAEHRLQLCLA